jgi:hypothetical protein
MIRNIMVILSICSLLLITGCSKVQVNPDLDASLGYEAFSSMKIINLRDIALGLYLSPKLVNATASQSIKMGQFDFAIGKALAVKLTKAMAYQFQEVHLLENTASKENVQALMRIELQDIDSKMDLKSGWSTVSAESYTRLAIRAELQDATTGKIMWIGTSQVNQTGGINEKILTYQEAGRGFASGFDGAIDKAVGDLLRQMNKSQNLRNYFKAIETARG